MVTPITQSQEDHDSDEDLVVTKQIDKRAVPLVQSLLMPLTQSSCSADIADSELSEGGSLSSQDTGVNSQDTVLSSQESSSQDTGSVSSTTRKRSLVQQFFTIEDTNNKTTNQNSLFRSRDWLPANQRAVFLIRSVPMLYP
eukprot:sb/3474264/